MTKRILLLGESGLDFWVRGTVDRVSAEAPVLIQKLTGSDTNPGMGGNVKANLESLWPGVGIDFIHQTRAMYKIRHIDEISGQQLLRVDDGDDSTDDTFEARALAKIESNKTGYCAVLISDYNKGLLTKEFIHKVVSKMHDLRVPVWLDSKKILGSWSKDIDFVKINEREYQAQLSGGCSEPWKACRNLIVTRGRDGAIWYGQDGSIQYVAKSLSRGLSCVSGAGDSVLAALVVSYLQEPDIKKSIDYSMKVAAVAVSKPKVVAVTWQEADAIV